ncbi:hypothetical protein SO486_05345 [Pseudomonas salmasensis]|uniref:Uncharacterized protein n=1 Tax=Pseudomonas salmasensis TaxID=2745514 RepID=A0ABU5FB80_9PSED|nr:hypothetical protein [Pseudomonas salmasensis]MDY4299419.1 hypothetical protein [Pseudomonas salmasensis]
MMDTLVLDTLKSAQPGERITGLDNKQRLIDGIFQSFDTNKGVVTLKAIGGVELQIHDAKNIKSISNLTSNMTARSVETYSAPSIEKTTTITRKLP